MPTVEHVVIAAAGFGSRLGFGYPKCLVEVHGRPILSHLLDLLVDVPDVRVVVGFEEDSVRRLAVSLRPDVVVVRNPAFATTSTLQSYALGARHLDDSCLFLDADILFDPASFAAFLRRCRPGSPLVGVTRAKTVDAVHAHVVDGQVVRFSRDDVSPWEWANIAHLPAGYCERGTGSVFEHLSRDLPLPAAVVESWEVDRRADLAQAELEYADPRPTGRTAPVG